VNTLATGTTIVRLSLHVLGAAVWVGGQITMLGLLPEVRRVGGDAAARLARSFAKVSWPAYALLVLTGIWNLSAVHASNATAAWTAVLVVKLVLVAVSGIAAWLHGRATRRSALAAWGSVAGASTLAAMVLGVALAG